MSGKNPIPTRDPQIYEGTNIIVPFGGTTIVKAKRDPTANDKKYPVSSYWINTATNTVFFLTSNATWVQVVVSALGGLTLNGVLIGQGSAPIVATAAGTNGQVFLGATSAAPAFGTLTTSTGIAYTTGANALAINVATDGFAVVNQATSSANLAAQTMYITNNGASLVTYTLPATVAVGTTIKIVGGSAGGWKIAQNAGQTIRLNSQVSTSGTGGSVSSTNSNNSVELVAFDATTNVWIIANSSAGSLTFV